VIRPLFGKSPKFRMLNAYLAVIAGGFESTKRVLRPLMMLNLAGPVPSLGGSICARKNLEFNKPSNRPALLPANYRISRRNATGGLAVPKTVMSEPIGYAV